MEITIAVDEERGPIPLQLVGDGICGDGIYERCAFDFCLTIPERGIYVMLDDAAYIVKASDIVLVIVATHNKTKKG